MKNGFTLIEMMVVLIILSVIGVMVVPNILGRPDEARVTVAKSDIKSIENALDLYKLDNFNYPTTEQGLKALVEKPTAAPVPQNWNGAAYLKKLPQDPWGNAYIYKQPGTKGEYDLISLGADGKEGGEGKSADIGNW